MTASAMGRFSTLALTGSGPVRRNSAPGRPGKPGGLSPGGPGKPPGVIHPVMPASNALNKRAAIRVVCLDCFTKLFDSVFDFVPRILDRVFSLLHCFIKLFPGLFTRV